MDYNWRNSLMSILSIVPELNTIEKVLQEDESFKPFQG
jgi:hypothetical protein